MYERATPLTCGTLDSGLLYTGRVSADASPRRVLVVDDDDAVRDLLKDFLERHGYLVSTVADGKAALNVMATEPPHVVLLDLRLPVMSGRDALDRLGTNDAPANPAVLLLSAAPELESTALEPGAAGTLGKPFDPTALLALLERLVPLAIAGSRSAR